MAKKNENQNNAEIQKTESNHNTPSPAYHNPVLLHQSIEALNIQPEGIYVDATFGGGGHSREIIQKLNTGHLYCFDQDPDAAANALNDHRCTFIPQNFRHMQKFLRLEGIKKVDGILADLGVSSYQFDQASRGFSIRFDAPLDMRMNSKQQLSAADVLNIYSEKQLQEMFSRYGEIRNSKQLAETIKTNRRTNKLYTTLQLVDLAKSVAKGELNKYLAQVFQSVRMEVNDELGALKEMLHATIQLLNPGGRLVVISYHSLEDRIVKNFLKTGNTDGVEEEDVFGRKNKYFDIITKKPFTPGTAELKVNPRSRSAKMRIGERLNT